MNRDRTLIIAASTITALACVAFYVSRSGTLAEVEAAVAKKKIMLGLSEVPHNSFAAPRPRGWSDNPQTQPVRQALNQLAALKAGYADRDASDRAYLKSAGKLLSQLQSLPLDDLLALADALDASADDHGKTSHLKSLILDLAAEINPQAVLARPDVAGNHELAAQPLAELAKSNPAAALRWVEASGLPKYELMHLKEIAIRSVFGNDFQKGLQLAAEHGVSAHILEHLTLEPGMIGPAAAALDDPRHAAVRAQIVGKIMETASYFSGIDGMREVVAKHHIPDADIAAFLAADHGKATWKLDPVKSVVWMDEVLSEEQKLKLIPQTLASWMDDDYNAAGIYLGAMPPSAIKDKAVGWFVVKTAEVDPSASAVWLMQIADPGQRQAAAGALLWEWRKTDPQAANAWLQASGLEEASLSTTP